MNETEWERRTDLMVSLQLSDRVARPSINVSRLVATNLPMIAPCHLGLSKIYSRETAPCYETSLGSDTCRMSSQLASCADKISVAL